MTVGQKWLKFKQDGYCGSLTIRSRSEQSFESDPDYNDKHIHEAILEMDPEYTYVKVIHEGYKGSQDIPTIERKTKTRSTTPSSKGLPTCAFSVKPIPAPLCNSATI